MVNKSKADGLWEIGAHVSVIVGLALLFSSTALRAEVTSADPVERFSQNVLSTLTEENAQDLALLTQFYVDRDMAPIWVDDQAPSERASDVLKVLEGSRYDGLNPEDYDVKAIKALMESKAPKALAELDLRLSLSLMQFLSDLGSGRTEPSALDPDLFVYPRDIDKAQAIADAAAADNISVFVGRFRPRQVDYWRLKGALANYRAMARAGGWPKVDDGPLLEAGERSPRVRQLRRLLLRLGDLKTKGDLAAKGGDPNVFDQGLVKAVERFQRRHGLGQDGMVGPNTLKALNTPIEERIQQIVLNLERRRWMSDRNGPRYIVVNLADFHLQLIDQDQIAFETPVVIGSLYNKTPIFSSEMTHLVINPYWNVPSSIAVGEIAAKVRADPTYLKSNGFDLFSDWSQNASLIDPGTIDWANQNADDFTYKLRQRPGPSNALGRLKFMMPNDYNIYLHDTPDRSHFGENERSFSHGCVRVADPEGLAAAILQGQNGWFHDNITSRVRSGKQLRINLDKPLPVQLTYLTSWIDRDNLIHFRNDVYDRDQVLADALIKSPRRTGTFAADISAETPDLTVAQ